MDESNVSPLVQIYPETGQRGCNNPPCYKKIGGGQGSWKRCSACLAAAIALRSVGQVADPIWLRNLMYRTLLKLTADYRQEAHWPAHKGPCKATVAERKKVLLTGIKEASEEEHLVGAYLEAWTRLTDELIQIAGRSALRIDREDSLVYTHFLEIQLEWLGVPSKVDFRDATAVIESFRLASITVIEAARSPGDLPAFKQRQKEHQGQYGFIIVLRLRDANSNEVGVKDSLSHMTYGNYTWAFRCGFGRTIAVNIDWEATLRGILEEGEFFWGRSEDERRGQSLANDIILNEGLEVFKKFRVYWAENQEICRWPPRVT